MASLRIEIEQIVNDESEMDGSTQSKIIGRTESADNSGGKSTWRLK